MLLCKPIIKRLRKESQKSIFYFSDQNVIINNSWVMLLAYTLSSTFLGIAVAVGIGIARTVVMCATVLVDAVVGIRRP